MSIAVPPRDAAGDIFMRSGLPTEVPPYFWTINPMDALVGLKKP